MNKAKAFVLIFGFVCLGLLVAILCKQYSNRAFAEHQSLLRPSQTVWMLDIEDCEKAGHTYKECLAKLPIKAYTDLSQKFIDLTK